jgi:hypothetical protein
MLEKVRDMSPVLVYLLLFIVALAGAYFLIALNNFSKKLSTIGKSGGKRPGGRLGCIATFLLLFFLFNLIFFAALLSPYQSFSKQELVAIVQCQSAAGTSSGFDLLLSPVKNGTRQDPKIFSLKGNSWAIHGEILNWGSLSSSSSLNAMYRLESIEGQSRASEPANLQSIGDEGKSQVWNALHKAARFVLFLKLSNHQTDPVVRNFTETFEVYVNQSGFKVQKAEGQGASLSRRESEPGEKSRSIRAKPKGLER